MATKKYEIRDVHGKSYGLRAVYRNQSFPDTHGWVNLKGEKRFVARTKRGKYFTLYEKEK